MVNEHMRSGGVGSLQPHEAMSQPKPELSADTTARVEPKGDHEGATKEVPYSSHLGVGVLALLHHLYHDAFCAS